MKSIYSSSGCREIQRAIALIWLLLPWAAPAAQTKLGSLGTCARSYTNVTVLTYNTTHVYFTHEHGSAGMKLKDLDPALQNRFDYDPAAAIEAEEEQAVNDARYTDSIASNIVARAQAAALAARRAAATSEDSLADPVSKSSLIGKPAPAIEGKKWLGEKPVLEGKPVLVAFWAPWSIPCRKYVPTLEKLQKKFAGKLSVVGVIAESEAELVDKDEPKVEFASVLDKEAKLGAAVGVTSVPYVMLVDAKGMVRYQGHPAAITEKQVEGVLAKAED